MLKYYLAELFEPTLLYSFALSILGVSAAYYYGQFSIIQGFLVIAGSVLAQISVNVISDYFDYSSGLDKELAKAKSGNLSGGSSLIAEGKIKPRYTLMAGIIACFFAGIIGIYFLTIHIELLPIIVIAGISIFTYAKFAKRIPYLSEPLCTLNYALIPLGSFVALAGVHSFPYTILFAFIPAGIMLGGDSLFINEIPDRNTDRKYGVRHSAVMLATDRKIALYYLIFQVIAYLIFAFGLLKGSLPLFAWFSLVALPATLYVFNGIYKSYTKKYGTYLAVQTWASFIFAIILSAAYIVML